ncbi:hypothetical protein NP493_2406g00000 [Ridgeia piscesae]|uniref:Uncharacterized protein n=1 Tax=Ridgeia piscesae TaxID=27915 RepID=A0AAD9JH06_RIDPI|nr:hypothetical protein NP493_2406g00000 [Ridgeia piscesae]
MFLSPIDEREVISVVNGCKSKTSTDCDDIDFRLIKSVITSIVMPITHIFNLSFQTGTFPEKKRKSPRSYHFLSREAKMISIITDLFSCSHNYLKSWKSFIATD